MTKHIIPIQIFREIFSYCPESGIITWKIKSRYGIYPGAEAGFISEGYRKIRYKGKNYSSHRVDWCLFYGEEPMHEIDHINGVKNDNRILNLRDVPRYKNAQNLQKAKSNSKTGILGVTQNKYGRYIASIRFPDGQKHLGTYESAIDASIAYARAKEIYHG